MPTSVSQMRKGYPRCSNAGAQYGGTLLVDCMARSASIALEALEYGSASPRQ